MFKYLKLYLYNRYNIKKMDFDVDKYISNPNKYLDSISIDVLVNFLEKANYMYRNTDTTLVNDELYDYALEYLRKKDKYHPFLSVVGIEVKDDERKQKLPLWMGSQDKIRDDPKALERWKNKYKEPFVISDKLDGISGLLVYSKELFNVYTRGDGEYGQLINGILPYIKTDKWKITNPVTIRGEFIISKKNWDENKHLGSNARNVVAGLLNSKKMKPEVGNLVDFIAYELIEPKLTYFEGLQFIEKLGLNVVDRVLIGENKLTLEFLSNHLMKQRSEGKYDIDGIIVRDNDKHNIISGKNPKYSFAFKSIMTHEEAEVMVDHVEWNTSKDGLLKPTVHFNTINIGGVKIKKATGYNAQFITTNVIGPGSKVVIIRSGDVIPKIIKVLTPSLNKKPDMPNIPYEWNETGVDITVIDNIDNKDILKKQLEHFVSTLNIMNIGEGIINKLYDIGIATVPQFMALTKEDFLLIDGVKDKSATKMFNSIQETINKVNCEELMAASNIFGRGFGIKKLKVIIESNPEILENKLIEKLNSTKSIGEKTEKQFLEKLPLFYNFLNEIGFKQCNKNSINKNNTISKNKTIEKILDEKIVVFTGFRNKEWETIIIEKGGKMGASISKNTSIVVTNDINSTSSKLNKAMELNIPILSKEDFEKKYIL